MPYFAENLDNIARIRYHKIEFMCMVSAYQMKQEGIMKDIKRLYVDFKNAQGMPNVRLVYHLLQHHNSAGRSKDTASTYLINAYNEYKKPHNDRLTEFMANFSLMEHIVGKYHFQNKEDIINYLKSTEAKPVEALPLASRRSFTFDMSKEDDAELYELLNDLNTRSKTLAITGIVMNYIRQGLDEYYLELAGDQFVQNLVNEYKADPDIVDSKDFNSMLDLMLFLGKNEIEKLKEEKNENRELLGSKERTKEAITKELLNG